MIKARLSASVIRGTASFYDFFNPQSKDADQVVCQGTACLVNGSAAKTAEQLPGAQRAMCCGYCYTVSGVLQRDGAGKLDDHQFTPQGMSSPEIPVYDLSSRGIVPCAVDSIRKEQFWAKRPGVSK